MNARDREFELAVVPDVWKKDFRHVAPLARRAARYVLQLLHSECTVLEQDEMGDFDSAWKIVEPLIDMRRANAAFATFDKEIRLFWTARALAPTWS